MSLPLFAGVDFGTTNSAVAFSDGTTRPRLIEMANGDQTLRSILYFDAEERDKRRRPQAYVGQTAIDAALDPIFEGRLIQSIKSYLTHSAFGSTSIYGVRMALSDLVAYIIAELRTQALQQIGQFEGPIVAGRPAEFVGSAEAGAEDLALTRLRDAYRFAGFGEVEFEFEPVAAAYAYATRLNHDELVLIADFGGGTSDFCLLNVGPSLRESAAQQDAIIAVDGVGIAGDAFDARIVEHCISPQLGRGSNYLAPSGKSLPMPNWVYDQLKAWHKLSFINTPRTHKILDEVIGGSADASAIVALKKLIHDNLGFHLYRAVEKTKHALSAEAETEFAFQIGPTRLNQRVRRAEFEEWIAPELKEIASCVERTLEKSNLAFADVDRVFMTGGSSFIPAVRAIFADRFGKEKLQGGEELTSVANGLALVAYDRYGRAA
ncbi:MAG: Hsp70 family protein [Alphaproteobacteria bacterium]|nr:MAG: Hsp70 family protein [Alphaproteobacteria bacterium]